MPKLVTTLPVTLVTLVLTTKPALTRPQKPPFELRPCRTVAHNTSKAPGRMEQPWGSIDLTADHASAKVLSNVEGLAPWPELSLLAAQSELRLQQFPALEARHTTESAVLLKAHKHDREILDRRYAEDSCTLEARHISERAALVDGYKYGREGLEQRFATESAEMQTRQLNETQAFLHQNLGLHKGMIEALAQQRNKQEKVTLTPPGQQLSESVVQLEQC